MSNLCHLLLDQCVSIIAANALQIDFPKDDMSLFPVGDKIDNHLGELERLDLGGKLEIRYIERVKDHMDAKKAKLGEKANLRNLILGWEGDSASGSREMMDNILEAPEPHPNIETLHILGFKGRSFPCWMSNSTMANVTQIFINECQNCLHLPPLGDLPRLKMLSLGSLDVEYIMEDAIQSGNPVKIKFPSLEELKLRGLPNLKALLKEEVREIFPNLQKLAIVECSSLRLPPLPSLRELVVRECCDSTLSSLSKLVNLTSLILVFGENVATCIPNEALANLSNLKKLMISNAHNYCLPEELSRLTALEFLYILNCKDLVELPDGIKYLHSLKTLQLQNLPEMICLPEGLQHVHSLEHLRLGRLDQLTSLPDWLDKLTSLQELEIAECPRVASLPSRIQLMRNLQRLLISGCPEIIRRCEKGNGEDWQKIAHIPDRRFHLDDYH